MIAKPRMVGDIVIGIVSTRTGFSKDDITGSSHSKNVTQARHLVVGALRLLGMSYPECGAVTNRHHTSSMNSWDQVVKDVGLYKQAEEVAEVARNQIFLG